MTLDAYWLTPFGSPGSADTTYIIGHSWEGRDSAFNHLSSQAKPGGRIVVTTKSGPATYTVKTVSTENKITLKDSPIWNKVPNRLILISCYTADLWGTNIVITADRTPTP
jgi:sortase (surface protein transpeptidase)